MVAVPSRVFLWCAIVWFTLCSESGPYADFSKLVRQKSGPSFRFPTFLQQSLNFKMQFKPGNIYTIKVGGSKLWGQVVKVEKFIWQFFQGYFFNPPSCDWSKISTCYNIIMFLQRHHLKKISVIILVSVLCAIQFQKNQSGKTLLEKKT